MSKQRITRITSENDIPLAAGRAFRVARQSAMRAGHTILFIENGNLIKIRAGAPEEIVRSVGRVDPRRVKLKKGVRTTIQWADNPA